MEIAAPRDVRLMQSGFSVGQALAAFAKAHPGSGGIASFTGKVRPDGDVKALELTHYPPLTLPGMVQLADAALARWGLDGLLAWHRVGVLRPGAPIVLVAAAAPHRRAAIEAVDFTMDHLKSAAWFWKRERTPAGWRWIEPRPQDYADRERWRDA
jgi:molybdopterin synthase catalytic subunit